MTHKDKGIFGKSDPEKVVEPLNSSGQNDLELKDVATE